MATAQLKTLAGTPTAHQAPSFAAVSGKVPAFSANPPLPGLSNVSSLASVGSAPRQEEEHKMATVEMSDDSSSESGIESCSFN